MFLLSRHSLFAFLLGGLFMVQPGGGAADPISLDDLFTIVKIPAEKKNHSEHRPTDSSYYTYDGRADLWVNIERHYVGPTRIPLVVFNPDVDGKKKAIIFTHGGLGRKENVFGVAYFAFALNGYLVAAPDMRAHGERGISLDQLRIAEDSPVKSRPGGLIPHVLDTGREDIPKIIDYLQSRDDVDPERIGMTGFSMGGACTWIVTASDTRIKAAVPSGAPMWVGDLFENKEALVRKLSPRPILIVHGLQDEVQPVAEPEENFSILKRVYAEQDAENKVDLKTYPVAHNYPSEAVADAIGWFERWL